MCEVILVNAEYFPGHYEFNILKSAWRNHSSLQILFNIYQHSVAAHIEMHYLQFSRSYLSHKT